MQMYDKIADCVYIFNKIYAGQVRFFWALSEMRISFKQIITTYCFSGFFYVSDKPVLHYANNLQIFVAFT